MRQYCRLRPRPIPLQQPTNSLVVLKMLMVVHT